MYFCAHKQISKTFQNQKLQQQVKYVQTLVFQISISYFLLSFIIKQEEERMREMIVRTPNYESYQQFMSLYFVLIVFNTHKERNKVKKTS